MSTAASSASGRTPSRAAIALALALIVGACGDDGAGGGSADRPTSDEVVDVSGTEPVGQVTAGSVAGRVECRDWSRATEDERLATIEEVRAAINLEGTGADAPPLSDDEAAAVFDGACDEPYARGYRLYKLYARAAGFAPLARELGIDPSGE